MAAPCQRHDPRSNTKTNTHDSLETASSVGSGSEEAQHQAAFKARAPVARWNRAIELLEATRLRLAAVESMTSAVADDDDGEDPA